MLGRAGHARSKNPGLAPQPESSGLRFAPPKDDDRMYRISMRPGSSSKKGGASAPPEGSSNLRDEHHMTMTLAFTSISE
jgi:hypothetical protein